MKGTGPTAVLDVLHAAFIQHRVSVHVASCDAHKQPSLTRALGCRVSGDRSELTVFLSVPRSTVVLKDLRAGGGIAVVFSRPSTHETLQIKAAAVKIGPLAAGDRDLVRGFGREFIAEINRLGFQDPFASAMVAAVEDEAVAISFMPDTAFNQTPGPQAGRPLVPGS